MPAWLVSVLLGGPGRGPVHWPVRVQLNPSQEIIQGGVSVKGLRLLLLLPPPSLTSQNKTWAMCDSHPSGFSFTSLKNFHPPLGWGLASAAYATLGPPPWIATFSYCVLDVDEDEKENRKSNRNNSNSVFVQRS